VPLSPDLAMQIVNNPNIDKSPNFVEVLTTVSEKSMAVKKTVSLEWMQRKKILMKELAEDLTQIFNEQAIKNVN
jgi:hypothetical protein